MALAGLLPGSLGGMRLPVVGRDLWSLPAWWSSWEEKARSVLESPRTVCVFFKKYIYLFIYLTDHITKHRFCSLLLSGLSGVVVFIVCLWCFEFFFNF